MRTSAISLPILVLALPGILFLGGCGNHAANDPPASASNGLLGQTFVSGSVTVTGSDPQPPAGGTDLSLTFTDNGISATGGCNTMSGAATLSNGTLTVDDQLASTQMGCEQDRMKQDQWFSDFLTSNPSLQLDDQALTLTFGSTTIKLQNEASVNPAPDLVGPTWKLDTISDGDMASSVPQGVTSSLTFTDKGRVEVAFGCNSGGGSYEVKGDVIHFGAMMSTAMACLGDRQDVENSVTKVLHDDVPFQIDSNGLTLTQGKDSLHYTATTAKQ